MTTCRKCHGTGKGPWRADFGRCWACGGTGDPTPVIRERTADDDAYAAEMGLGRSLGEIVTARRARRATAAES